MNWLRQIFLRRRIFDDLSEEIKQHLEEKTEALMAEGMSRREAAASARPFLNLDCFISIIQ